MFRASSIFIFCLICLMVICVPFFYDDFFWQSVDSNSSMILEKNFKEKPLIVDEVEDKEEVTAPQKPSQNREVSSQESILEKEEPINFANIELQKNDEGKLPLKNHLFDTNFSTSYGNYSLNEEWVPVHGDDIQKSTSKAKFYIKDAKGKLLEMRVLEKVRLHRKVHGDYWINSPASYDHNKGVLSCNGVNGLGLEQGDYILEIDGGFYGYLKFSFLIKKDEDFSETLFLPNYRKIITMYFSGLDKEPLEYLKTRPIYKCKKTKVNFIKFKTKKYLFLNHPPSNSMKMYGGGRHRMILRGCGSVYENVIKTDKGKFYLRVFSGQTGTLRFSHAKNSNSADFELTSTFGEKEKTDIYITTIGPVIEKRGDRFYLVATGKEVSTGSQTLGNRRVIKDVVLNKLTRVISGTERFLNNYTGLVLALKSSHKDLTLQVELKDKLKIFIHGSHNIFQKNISDFNLTADAIEKYRWTDKKLFYSEWVDLNIEKDLVTRKTDTQSLKSLDFNFDFSPTMTAYMRGLVNLKTNTEGAIATFGSAENEPLSSYVNHKTELLSLKISVPGYYGDRGFLFSRQDHLGLKKSINITLNKTLLNHERVMLPPFLNTVVLRTLDAVGAGLPWVEASVVCHDEMTHALKLRKVFMNTSAKRLLANINGLDYFYMKKDPSFKESKENWKTIKSVVSDDDSQRFLVKNGAWYNTHSKGLSDAKGYLVISNPMIKPGKKYSIFLWFDSKNQMMPDKVITFTAGKNTTDLGAIRF